MNAALAFKMLIGVVASLVICCGLAVLISSALDWGNDDED